MTIQRSENGENNARKITTSRFTSPSYKNFSKSHRATNNTNNTNNFAISASPSFLLFISLVASQKKRKKFSLNETFYARAERHTRYNLVGSRQTIAKRERREVVKRGRGRRVDGGERVNCSYVHPHTNHPSRRVGARNVVVGRALEDPWTVGVASNLMDRTDTYGQIATNTTLSPLISIPRGWTSAFDNRKYPLVPG